MKFSLPSFGQLVQKGLKTYYRFPFVIISAIIATAAAIWMVEIPYDKQDSYYWLNKLIFISGLGIPLFFAVNTFSERAGWDTLRAYLARAATLILLALYYIFSEDGFTVGPAKIWYRFALFFVAAHLFAAFSPFIKSGDLPLFWEYNKTLFLRILTSVLYSGVLFAGLSIAMLSIDNLLGIDIDEDRYLQLFIFLAGVFNTCFFLAGIPELQGNTKLNPEFPNALKIFVQYVLIPLVTVYIFILYLYTGKILFQWELPNGWVSNLVLSFSIAGILSLLLLYPIRDKEENRWIKLYSNSYYAALIPLIVLLMFSIWVRISEYGITVNRYFVAILGLWLSGIVLYFLISKTKNIKVIPISLCIVALAVSFGPGGAFSVSEKSQQERFEAILSRNNMLDTNHQAQPKTEKISFEDQKALSSVVDYLISTHGENTLQKYFRADLQTELNPPETPKPYSNTKNEKIMQMLELEYIHEWEQIENWSEDATGFGYSIEKESATPITGYDYHLKGISFFSGDDSTIIANDENTWSIHYDYNEEVLHIAERQTKKEISLSVLDLISFLKDKYPGKVKTPADIPASDMIIQSENEDLQVMVMVTFIGGSYGENTRLSNFSMELFIGIK